MNEPPRLLGDSPENASLSPPKISGRISELDGLRGVAILLVVFYHFATNGAASPTGSILARFRSLFKLGWSGVDLFFVLSGFLIGSILLDARNSPRYFQTFYLRRVHRIMPIYYLFVILYGLFALCAAGKLPPPLAVPQLNRWLVPAHLLFLQNIVNFPGNIFHRQCLAALWSLAVEEQFYLGVPLLIHFLSKRNLVRVLMFAVVAAPMIRVFLLHAGHPGGMFVLMPSRADALALGVLAAVAWRSPRARAWLTVNSILRNAILTVLFGLTVWMAFFWPKPESMFMAAVGFSALAMFYALVLLSVLLRSESWLARVARMPLLQHFGVISYCMYLVHMPLNPLTHWVVGRAWVGFNTAPEIAMTILAFAVTWGVALLSWRYIEKPLIRRGHTYSY